MTHALVKLARTIDWRFLEEKLGAVYTDKPGHRTPKKAGRSSARQKKAG
jgi:hypothetical protein